MVPSVMAKLMGLDELSPRQPVQKQQKVLSEDYLRKTASIGVRKKRSSYEGCSFRMTGEGSQEFKAISQVPSATRMDKHRHLSPRKGKACSNLTGGNAALQKFVEPDNLSMNDKLQHSEELDGRLEVLNYSNNLLVGNLQKQGSFFARHLHNAQGVSPCLQSGNVTGLKSSTASSHRKNKMYGRLEGREHSLKSFQKPRNYLVPCSHEELGADCSHNLLKSQSHSVDDRCISSTRIVVLRPNPGKTPDSRSLLSTSSLEGSQSSYGRHKDIPHSKNEEVCVETRERKPLGSSDKEPFWSGSKISGETAYLIGKPMNHTASNSFTESRSGFGVSDTSLNEFGVVKPSSLGLINWKNRHQKSFYYWNGFSVTRGPKKQLLERWKMTETFQEIGLVIRGDTLGEMLAMPDHGRRSRNLDYQCGKNGQNRQSGANGGDASLSASLVISSNNGWKGGCVKSYPKYGCLPASASIASHKPMTENKSFHRDWSMRLEEAADGDPRRSRKQDSNLNDFSGPGNLRLSSQKSVFIPFLDSENNHTVEEACVTLSELKEKIEEIGSSECSYGVPKLMSSRCSLSGSKGCNTVQKQQKIQHLLNDSVEQNSQVSEISIVNVASISAPSDVAHSEYKDDLSFRITKYQRSKPMPVITLVKDRDSASSDSVASILEEASIESPGGSSVSSHCPGSNPESSGSLEEAYQPSPISVLELPFKGEISSGFQCLGSVGDDIWGLHAQLQLLKSESLEAYSEGPGMVISSDEDTEEESVGFNDEKGEPRGLCKTRESRDFSYLVDVLVEAGFSENDLEMDLETWHSPECPINRSVFEKLEKNYGEQRSWNRSERMLLFDRINSGLMEILWPRTEIHMWMGSVTKRLQFKLSQELIEEELWKVLTSEEKQMGKNLSEKALGREKQWLELGDDIAIIGREIESLLLDELAAEFMSMENFWTI